MRIIGGKLKGKRIEAKKNMDLRPTTDFAKEGLFNVLENMIDNWAEIRVLDLFAGLGGISYEFVSRGVENIHINDWEHKHLQCIMENCKTLGISAKFSRLDAQACLQKASGFQLIFADPPYDYKHHDSLHQLVFEKPCLDKGGWFILEHDAKNKQEDKKYFKFAKKYGNVVFSFFEYV